MENIEARVTVLESKMEWSEETFQRIEGSLESLKQGQIRLLERFSELQAYTDGRLTTLFQLIATNQTRTDERITGLHQAIVTQTRWILGAVLGGATLLAFLQKILEQLF